MESLIDGQLDRWIDRSISILQYDMTHTHILQVSLDVITWDLVEVMIDWNSRSCSLQWVCCLMLLSCINSHVWWCQIHVVYQVKFRPYYIHVHIHNTNAHITHMCIFVCVFCLCMFIYDLCTLFAEHPEVNRHTWSTESLTRRGPTVGAVATQNTKFRLVNYYDLSCLTHQDLPKKSWEMVCYYDEKKGMGQQPSTPLLSRFLVDQYGKPHQQTSRRNTCRLD